MPTKPIATKQHYIANEPSLTTTANEQQTEPYYNYLPSPTEVIICQTRKNIEEPI